MVARVLIADDSTFMRNLLDAVLSNTHTIIGKATNGVEAVVEFEESHPDVVLMNIVMPIQDGIEATAEIKSQAPDAAVIICTSNEQEAMMRRAIEAGADAYVTKPFQKDSLLATVEDVL